MSTRTKLALLTTAGALLTSLLTACGDDPNFQPTVFEDYKGTVLQARPTTQYGGGTEMHLLRDNGEVLVFGVDFRDNPPIRIESNPDATEDTIACDALSVYRSQLDSEQTQNCVITSSNPGKFFALGDD